MKQFAAIVVLLAAIAAVAPSPWYLTDRTTYERIGRELIVRDCSDIHCFRILVPAVIEHLPGPSLVKWTAYAVLANAAAAVIVGRLALAFGLAASTATLATWLSALGFGSLFTLFDPHTADPLMFALAPMLTLLILEQRIGRASGIAAIGIFAKEFAAAPLWIGAGAAWLAGRRASLVRLVCGAAAVTTLWLLFQLTLLTAFDYSYANSYAVRLSEGGYLAHWVSEVGARTAATTLLTDYGPLYLLVPAGWLVASLELRRWAAAALPALLILVYVQQPDRALWNFHFVATPLAALAIARLPRVAAWMFVALYGVANLRVGAQLSFVPAARFALLLSVVLGAVGAVRVWRERAAACGTVPAIADPPIAARERRAITWIAVTVACALAVCAAVMLDSAMHRRVELAGGLNKWGYRGPVARPKKPGEVRIAILGNDFAYGAGVDWNLTFGAVLERYVKQGWRANYLMAPASVVNLSDPHDLPSSLAATLQDYEYLAPDVVIVVAEPPARAPQPVEESWRRRSIVFRATGYLPLLPDAFASVNASERAASDVTPADACDGFCGPIAAAVDAVLAQGCRALVVSPPYRSAADRARQAALAASLSSRLETNRRLRYLNLGPKFDFADRAFSADGAHLTPVAHEQVAEALTDPILELVRL